MPTPDIPYDWSILTLDVNHVIGILRSNKTTATRTSKKKTKQNKKGNRFNEQTTTLHVHHTFLCISLPFSRFMENVSKQQRNFFLHVSGLGYGPLEFIFRNNRDEYWKNANSLFIISDVLVAFTSLDKEKRKRAGKTRPLTRHILIF